MEVEYVLRGKLEMLSGVWEGLDIPRVGDEVFLRGGCVVTRRKFHPAGASVTLFVEELVAPTPDHTQPAQPDTEPSLRKAILDTAVAQVIEDWTPQEAAEAIAGEVSEGMEFYDFFQAGLTIFSWYPHEPAMTASSSGRIISGPEPSAVSRAHTSVLAKMGWRPSRHGIGFVWDGP